MGRLLGTASSAAATGANIVLVPVGSIEQHGPHLPLDTDTVIAEAVANRVALRLPDALVAPAIAYGSSGEHQAFAGTSSIGTDVLRQVVIELTRSMSNWVRRLIFVNGHGGNVFAMTAALEQMVGEGHDACWVPCDMPGADAHAGRTETSLMLYLRPGAVRLEHASAGNRAPLRSLMPILTTQGVQAVSRNGVLGDPTGANAAEGRHLLEVMVHRALESIAHVNA
jgi:mycofactocin precursor peptide peptidase